MIMIAILTINEICILNDLCMGLLGHPMDPQDHLVVLQVHQGLVDHQVLT